MQLNRGVAEPVFRPAIGKYFEGYKQFKHVIVPIRIYEYRKHADLESVSSDQLFIFEFVGAFKHAFNHKVTFAQGSLLEALWPPIK